MMNDNYCFNWKGKNEMLKSIDNIKECNFILDEKESKNADTTNNLFFECDNIFCLKHLQKEYSNKIKMIYIDPPYNTRSKKQYNDNFYNKSYSNDFDKNHADWLNMMYPRLKLARNLLTHDGVIFISIDDNEQANLKKMCDEIFGEHNFVGDLIRKTKSTTNNIKTGFNIQHENTLIFAKNKENILLLGKKKSWSDYKNLDNDPKGSWINDNPSVKGGCYFEIKNPYTGKVDYPPKHTGWRFSKISFYEFVKNKKIIFKEKYGENERGFIFKRYKNDVKNKYNTVNSLNVENIVMNQNATKHMNKIFPEADVFQYTKPIEFLKYIIKSNCQNGDIALDFFAGSGTTAHAMMELNAEDGGNRCCISVQMPELTDYKSEVYKAGYKNVAEITKERMRRAGEKIKKEKENTENLDIGFKVFKLANNNS